MDRILIPTAPGELVDKLTILRLKSERITDLAKLENVRLEMAALQQVADARLAKSADLTSLTNDLYQVNAALWEIEDDIRTCELNQDFGPEFVRLARAVYVTNDQRAALKKAINLLLGSELVEEKSYQDYGTPQK